jgi:class 3 adenylate cyclase
VSFVSRTLLSRLLSRQPLRASEHRDEEGAVLLSDIEGFTAMVERFSQPGAAGVEAIASALNGYLADVVEIVNRYAGDVIAIAGDSVLCFWKATGDLSLEEACAHAGQAALAIQSALHERETAHDLFFRTRIGIGSGPVTLSFVGGFNGRWECLLSGPALDAAVNAERIASAGEVILAHGAAALLDPFGCHESARQGHRRLLTMAIPPPSLPPPTQEAGATQDVLAPFLPRALLSRLDLPSATWLPEFRLVTLFLATVTTHSAESALCTGPAGSAHRLILRFQEVVEEFGGTAKVDLDAKGTLLLGVWGLPPQAHEDDALLAVEAARALHEYASGEQRMSIGVATGRVLCGAFGSRSRSEYIVRGPVINVAARLMVAAVGELLADLATVHAARQRIVYEERPALKVKGLAEPVPVVRPTGKCTRLLNCAGSIVGRNVESERLIAALEDLLQHGVGSSWLIEAEAGLGKTLLSQLVAREAKIRNGSVLVATADAIEGRRAFGAWRDVLRALLGSGDDATMRQLLFERLRSLPGLLTLAPLANDVLPLGLSDNSLTMEMTGQVRAESTRRLMSGLLMASVREQPCVLIFEDAHWADSLSCVLVEDLVSADLALMMLITTRPDPINSLSFQSQLKQEHVIVLDGLHDDEIDRLVCSELGLRSVPSRLLHWIRERVAGHPFFASELIRSLHATGAVSVQDGRCAIGDLEQLTLPFSIEGAITSRINQLSPSQQLTLKVAAVIGRVFTEPLLCTTHPAGSAEVQEHCKLFERSELAIRLVKQATRTYEFRHILVRDVAYGLLPLTQQKLLHRAVALRIEAEYEDQLSAVASQLAQHWERAGDLQRSITFLELAGDHDLRTGAFKEALLNFQKSLLNAQCSPNLVDSTQLARLQMGLGKASYFLGDLNGSRRCLEQAVRELDRSVPSSMQATLSSLLREAFVQMSHRLLGVFNKISDRKQQTVIATVCDGYRCLAQIYFLQDQPAPWLAYLTLRSVNLGERAGASASLARSLANLGVVLSLIGLKAWSDWYGSHSVAMADQEGQYAAGSYVRHVNAIRLVSIGCAEDALRSSSEALELIEVLGDFNLELEATSVRAMIAAISGDFNAAEIAARRCVHLSRRTGSLMLGGWAQLNLIDVALSRNDLARAQIALAEGRAMLAGLSDQPTLVLMHRAEATLARYERRWMDALRSSRALIDAIGSSMPSAYYIADAFGLACSIVADAARNGQVVSRTELRRCERRLRRLSKNHWDLQRYLQSLR